MPAYKVNPDLKVRADRIIDKHRPNLKILSICYMFREEAAISDGKVIAGMCIRVDDRHHAIHRHDFLIEIAKDVWDEAPSEEFKDALLDHELGHCGIRFDEDDTPMSDERTGRWKTYIHKHDVEEFEDVLQRHGAYHEALRSFLRSYAQKVIDAKKSRGRDEGGTTGGDMEE